MRRTSFADVNCSIAQAVEVIGDPWSVLIVRDAFFGLRRFEELRARLEIPRNTLASRLEHICGHGVLERVPSQERPDRSEYRLTDKGRALGPVLVTLVRWGDEWSGLDEPPVVMVERSTGRVLDPVLADRETGELFEDLDYRPEPGPGARHGRRIATAS